MREIPMSVVMDILTHAAGGVTDMGAGSSPDKTEAEVEVLVNYGMMHGVAMVLGQHCGHEMSVIREVLGEKVRCETCEDAATP